MRKSVLALCALVIVTVSQPALADRSEAFSHRKTAFDDASGQNEVAAGVYAVNSVTPSTNEDNKTNGWAHVNVLDVGPGYTELEFVSTRSFASCFEYRTDGDTSQKTSETNFNPDITDGLYPFVCVNNSTSTKTIEADAYVEVRMVFGAERDERFDWTRFDVDPIPYACEGFLPPANDAVSVQKPNRVLPLRMILLDGDGMSVWDLTPPVVSVSFTPAAGGTATDVEELTFAGQGDEGNRFFFNGSYWRFNLSTRGFASGVYTITAVPGASDYAISPTCEVELTVR